MTVLARISIFPIKSMDRLDIYESRITRGGFLEHDRQLAIFDNQGQLVNGKHYASIHKIRSHFDLKRNTLSLHSDDNDSVTLNIETERSHIEEWLSQYFGFDVRLVGNDETGFPDDTEAYGPTIISSATLAEVATWYSGFNVDNSRRRFRANLEINDVPAFWEDHLFAEPNTLVEFSIGTVRFHGINPCQRCVVPTRHPETGLSNPHFAKVFQEKRAANLPIWANRERFNHFYRLAINTRIPRSEEGKIIRVGDPVTILGISEV